MKVVDKFKELPPGAQIAIMLLGGATLLVGGIMIAKSGSSPAGAAPQPQPLPGPGPTPLPIPEKAPYHITYRGVTATIGQNPQDPTNWIAVYAINGEKAGISAHTNESGIVRRFNDAVDAYYANAKWFPMSLASGAVLRGGSVYRLSLPSDAHVALPLITGGRSVPFSGLPVDWPPDDRTDPTRQRYEFWPSSDLSLPPIDGAFAWALLASSAPMPQV